MKCSNCGETLLDGEVEKEEGFCPYCGNPIVDWDEDPDEDGALEEQFDSDDDDIDGFPWSNNDEDIDEEFFDGLDLDEDEFDGDDELGDDEDEEDD